ncbi:hypothetical protein EV401DRAFT_1055487 [Pisolithus croceorrhizus]|nr:hypothetical protein EV401DRAFT_1055487 [Pisolithus croceorrhizus]
MRSLEDEIYIQSPRNTARRLFQLEISRQEGDRLSVRSSAFSSSPSAAVARATPSGAKSMFKNHLVGRPHTHVFIRAYRPSVKSCCTGSSGRYTICTTPIRDGEFIPSLPSVSCPSSHSAWGSCGPSIRTRLTNRFKLLIQGHPGTWSLPETPRIRGREHHCLTWRRLAAMLWTPIGRRCFSVPVSSGIRWRSSCRRHLPS